MVFIIALIMIIIGLIALIKLDEVHIPFVIVGNAEKNTTQYLHFINKCYADYLDYILYVKEGIHIVQIN